MQLVLILHGNGCLQTEAGKLDLEFGDVVSIRPGTLHYFADCQALQTIHCGFSSRDFRRRVGEALDAKALSVILNASAVAKYPIMPEHFRSIAAQLSASGLTGDMGNIGRLLLLLECIVDRGKLKFKEIHRAVFESVQQFDENFTKDWSLPEIAEAVGLDPSYLARLFTSNLGTPPLSYLNLLRTEEAGLLLMTGDSPCAKVGFEVGWDDPNYFSRRFRQHFGMSPTAFRQHYVAQGANLAKS